MKAKFDKSGKLKLVQTRSFETQIGAMSIKNVEIWQLLNDDKNLLVKREIETPRGVISAEMYFIKQ